MKMLLNSRKIELVDSDPLTVIKDKINLRSCEDNMDAFFVGDLGNIVSKFDLWKKHLPQVEPFYAVKCNDDTTILSILAKLGCGFDCASKGEIQKVLQLKVSPDRIIYANPCKQSSHIKMAARSDVKLMTFDNATELHKIKEIHPDAKMVLRILPPSNTKCQCELGMKFGCQTSQVVPLLLLAKELNIDVIGVSFHVGSGCYDARAYSAAVEAANLVFSIAKRLGFHFTLLDIGGGFPGTENPKLSFPEIAVELNEALATYFPPESGVRLIAEPGRFFVASAFTLAVSVIASRTIISDLDDQKKSFMYYVNDGVYGSFNCLLYDHALVTPLVAKDTNEDAALFESSLWGPTCDGLDCIVKQCFLPILLTGDWLLFKDMGAYTMTAASCFNGMPKSKCSYTMSEHCWDNLFKDDIQSAYPIIMKTGHAIENESSDIFNQPLEI